MQWWLWCVAVALLLSSCCPRQVLICYSPVSHLSALWECLWILYSTPLSLEAAADPDHFLLAAFFQAQNWNSFTSACSAEANKEVTEIWHPSGPFVWFPTHLMSTLLGLVWEPCLTGSSSAMSMTCRELALHIFHQLWVENSEQKQTDTWRESQIFGRGEGEDFCKFFLLGKR